MSVESTAHSPSARGNHPALRSCWHPVAYEHALGAAPKPARPARGTARPLARLDRRRACLLRPLHPPRHGALAGNRGGGRDRLPVSRLALRGERRVHGRSRNSPIRLAFRRRRVRRSSDARSATGSTGSHSTSRAGRSRTCPSSRSDAWHAVTCGPNDWRVRFIPAGRELHRLRPLPVRSSGAARRSGASGHPQPRRGGRKGTSSTTRSSVQRRRIPTTSRSSERRRVEQPDRHSRYELHLPYTIVLRLGWGGERGDGLLLRLAAGAARTSARDSSGSGATTTSISPTRSCSDSRT